tara:strand:- start:228 stop:1283 length:1056 start_codon:yes stop_codon:yes gene_type:complete
MAQKRLTRKLTDIITEVEQQLKAHYGVTQKEIDAWRARAKALTYKFPISSMITIEDLWIDYEVQRDVLYKHIVNIMRKWDPRICSSGSACRTTKANSNIYLYDAQHRTIAAGILGFTEVPCAVVVDDDPNFPSYAFELLNDTGVKRLTPGDLHRNALVRFKNGSRETKVVHARTMQDQFDSAGIDLQDKGSRDSATLCGDNEYFFSHFKYAQKGIDVDNKGRVLLEILESIQNIFSKQEEIDQGVYIGLLELHKLASAEVSRLPSGWMKEVLEKCTQSFKRSHTLHEKAKRQWEHVNPGATWSAPSAMSNFIREIYIRNGGSLNLPYHGEGSKMGIEEGNFAPGLFGSEQA